MSAVRPSSLRPEGKARPRAGRRGGGGRGGAGCPPSWHVARVGVYRMPPGPGPLTTSPPDSLVVCQWESFTAVPSPVPAPQNRTSPRHGEWGSPGGGVGADCAVRRGAGSPVRVQPRPRLRAHGFLVARLGESSSPDWLLVGLEDAAWALPGMEVEKPLDPPEGPFRDSFGAATAPGRSENLRTGSQGLVKATNPSHFLKWSHLPTALRRGPLGHLVCSSVVGTDVSRRPLPCALCLAAESPVARLWEEFPIAPSSPVAGMAAVGWAGGALAIAPIHRKDVGRLLLWRKLLSRCLILRFQC